MIRVMDSIHEQTRNSEKTINPQLWQACAGEMVHIPPINSKVLYFPQGHAECAEHNIQFGNSRIPPLIPCEVSSIKYMADLEIDEIFAKIRLIPLKNDEFGYENGDDGLMGIDGSDHIQENPSSFSKMLTQSDANNGGGFSMPRYCAETILPRLDYSVDPPVQTILAKDVHGETWKFRHIYRGTPRRHLLTTGWSNFVNRKKLVAGDSVLFFREENGNIRIGIRRAKRGIGVYRNESIRRSSSPGFGGRASDKSVIKAMNLAACGKPFEIMYYPCESNLEFCVKAPTVRDAMRIRWCPGMRFKMPFETDDSSRISSFMGTISSVRVVDPINWPDSPWRLIEVAWDEPDLLQHVKRVNPWSIEVAITIPAIHLPPFSPPRKKMRVQLNPNLSIFSQFPTSSFLTNFINSTSHIPFSNGISSSIQGARHAQIGSNAKFFKEKNENKIKRPHIYLFGQLIMPDQQILDNESFDENLEYTGNFSDGSGSSSNSSVLGSHEEII